VEEVRARVERFRGLLGLRAPISVSRVQAHVYRVAPGRARSD
jgi:hypothetical protein